MESSDKDSNGFPVKNVCVQINQDPTPEGDNLVTPLYVLDNTMTQQRLIAISQAMHTNDLPTAVEHLLAGGEGVMLVEVVEVSSFREKTSLLEYLDSIQTPLLWLPRPLALVPVD